MIHTVKGFGIVNKAEVDVFLELSCFFYDPTDVGNLISGSSAFSKTSLNIWMFTVHILLKPGLENFEHYFTSVWDECNCAVVWTCLASPFLGIGMKTDLFQSCHYCWIFTRSKGLLKEDWLGSEMVAYLLLLPSSFPSIRVFSSESPLWIMWPKYWSFSFSISPSNE